MCVHVHVCVCVCACVCVYPVSKLQVTEIFLMPIGRIVER